MKNCFLSNRPNDFLRVYPQSILDALGFDGNIYSREAVLSAPSAFSQIEYVFSTWGMPVFSAEEIRRIFPSLKCVFYAAGSVQSFARPFMECGVKIFSAWEANAVPVAEYTLAQILLANKGFFTMAPLRSRGDIQNSAALYAKYPGNFEVKVGFIGAGMISKTVMKLLKPFHIDIMVCSSHLSEAEAASYGAKKATLEEVFSQCQVVSNHLANTPKNVGILNGKLFRSMLPYSTFINTGRGAQVVEEDLVEVLRERPDLCAVLDVTYPEPPEPGHLFYELDNCILTPHIAGSLGNEVHRMAEYMLQEYECFLTGEPCRYEVSEKMLETMA